MFIRKTSRRKKTTVNRLSIPMFCVIRGVHRGGYMGALPTPSFLERTKLSPPPGKFQCTPLIVISRAHCIWPNVAFLSWNICINKMSYLKIASYYIVGWYSKPTSLITLSWYLTLTDLWCAHWTKQKEKVKGIEPLSQTQIF